MKLKKHASSVGIAELKARLSSFIRRVKSGDEVEILERGVPVATLRPVHAKSTLGIVSPRKDPSLLATFRFSVYPKARFDAVKFLLEDRQKR